MCREAQGLRLTLLTLISGFPPTARMTALGLSRALTPHPTSIKAPCQDQRKWESDPLIILAVPSRPAPDKGLRLTPLTLISGFPPTARMTALGLSRALTPHPTSIKAPCQDQRKRESDPLVILVCAQLNDARLVPGNPVITLSGLDSRLRGNDGERCGFASLPINPS